MENTNNDIIIIGAGISGLMAARGLSARGFKVAVLEGNDRIGGRINTIIDDSFDKHLEAGAEFIHGNLPETIKLLNEAGIKFTAVEGKLYRVKMGKWKSVNDPSEGWDELMKKMNGLEEDMPIADFLSKYFGDEKHAALRDNIRHYTEGMDAADIHTASVIALRNEWENEDEDQYRVDGGYIELIKYLIKECLANGCIINLSCIVKEVRWEENKVEVGTSNGTTFYANKVIVTVPVSILQQDKDHIAGIEFIPAIDNYVDAAKKIGFGAVIKIFLQFKEPLWNKKSSDASFILSSQVIPTWWTQLPDKVNFLTGWLGGPNAKALREADPDIILKLALESLSGIFSIDINELKDELTEWKIADWNTDVFSLGAYSFATVESSEARKLLNTPVHQTLFFAGEGLYEGKSPGTVEAALVSGKNVAEMITA